MPIDSARQPRSVLKSHFVKNAIPTEEQFAELVDGTLNLRDDGIRKAAGDPLGIEAAGDDLGVKRAVAFWSSFADPNPAWTVSLRARRVAADPESARPGWNLLDAAGTPRLTVDADTGNVGIGTVQPREQLEVAGRVSAGPMTIGAWAPDAAYAAIGSNAIDQAARENFALLQHVGGTTYLNSATALYLQVRNSDRVVISDADVALTRPLRIFGLTVGPWPANPAYLHVGLNALDQAQPGNYALLVGDAAERGVTFLNSPTKVNVRVANADRLVVEDQAVTVARTLRVGGALVPSAGKAAGTGISFPDNPGGGGGDGAWLRYYARQGEATTLEIGTSNDPDDHIALMASGNVGVGVVDPTAKLDVAGDTLVRGSLRVAGAISAEQGIRTRGIGGIAGPLRIAADVVIDGTLRASAATSLGGSVTVDGPLQLQSTLVLQGRLGFSGDADWLRFNQDNNFKRGVHTPSLFSSHALIVGNWNGYAHPGEGNLAVAGLIRPSAGTGERGIVWPLDAAGGSGDAAWIRYFARSGEAMTLEIGISNDPDDHIALMPSGNVGVGTQNPQAKLDVMGMVRCRGFDNQSSATLKKNIRPLDGARAASIVAGLDPVTFEWKDGEAREQLGFIAEDAPEAVATARRDGVSIGHIIAALTRVVRDQTATVAALTDRLARLEARA